MNMIRISNEEGGVLQWSIKKLPSSGLLFHHLHFYKSTFTRNQMKGKLAVDKDKMKN